MISAQVHEPFGSEAMRRWRAPLASTEAFAAEQGYRLHGRHHEIYLGDPRRSAPERLRTIIRHPVQAGSP